jgi:hypothetical protein
MAITIAFEELDGSPEETITDEGFAAVRTLKCAWADRRILAVELKGSALKIGSNTVYIGAESYPGVPSMTVADVQIRPFHNKQTTTFDEANPTKLATYEHALLTVRYSTKSFDPSSGIPGEGGDDIFATERLEPTAELLNLDTTNLFWDASQTEPLGLQTPMSKLVPGLDYIYERRRVPQVPPATFTLVGKVNSGALISNTLGITFAAETLLYNPPTLDRETILLSDGSTSVTAWNIVYRFTYDPEGWNTAYRNGFTAKQTVYDDSGSVFKKFSSGDFTQIKV